MQDRKLRRLTDSVYFLPPEANTDRPVLAAICGQERTLIVDAGNSPSHAALFLEEVAKEQISNLHSVVLTHCHWDHIFGAHRLNLPIIAHERTKDAIEQMIPLSWTDEALDERVNKGTEFQFCADMIKKEFAKDRDIVIQRPHKTFKDKMEIDLGGTQCYLEYVGGDHSNDSIVVYTQGNGEGERTLFIGDCLYPNLNGRYTVAGTLSLLEKLDRYSADYYVLSHEMPLSPDEFRQYCDLLRLLCHLTEKTKGHGEGMIQELTDRWGGPPEPFMLEAVHCFVQGFRSENGG
ncbi:MBL fold metallo-hydrolase [Paenibacillus sp. J2TS4]|uniref:MBL fold metallo-hydrolase n=1 Tax=Paenibacillus sp. J2TS4 TaxID=2807194 RepID=UPI001B112FBA|nr:MBL fold metallo-hydrolase [Paenibacillus sp. J2TS4]GIP32234.1 Zn-dependent hydrolase [Paenibacillus sp. J2TS4]